MVEGAVSGKYEVVDVSGGEKYVVDDGLVMGFFILSDGKMYCYSVYLPGDYFGAFEEILGEDVYLLGRDVKLTEVGDDEDILQRQCDALAHHIRMNILPSVEEKYEALRYRFSDHNHLFNDLSHREIAMMINCARETVTRTLNDKGKKKCLSL